MIHTPPISEVFLHQLQLSTGFYFEDSSWKNDLSDSVTYGDEVKIIFPNSTIDNDDKELFSTFSFEYESHTNIGETISETFNSFTDLVDFLNNGSIGRLLNACMENQRANDRKVLKQEKQDIKKTFDQIFYDHFDNALLTHDMLKQISDTALNLIKTDF